jgi:hypothetical protein
MVETFIQFWAMLTWAQVAMVTIGLIMAYFLVYILLFIAVCLIVIVGGVSVIAGVELYHFLERKRKRRK